VERLVERVHAMWILKEDTDRTVLYCTCAMRCDAMRFFELCLFHLLMLSSLSIPLLSAQPHTTPLIRSLTTALKAGPRQLAGIPCSQKPKIKICVYSPEMPWPYPSLVLRATQQESRGNGVILGGAIGAERGAASGIARVAQY
jgi:hypothetical protein